MGDSEEYPETAELLPESLVRQLDSLEIQELKAVLSYLNQRIEVLRPPIEEEIMAETAGEIIEIENRNAYAIVRMHPPDPDESGSLTDVISLYHVRREPKPDGTASLHWEYLGDTRNPPEFRCSTCGRKLESDVTRCPYCNPDQSEHSE